MRLQRVILPLLAVTLITVGAVTLRQAVSIDWPTGEREWLPTSTSEGDSPGAPTLSLQALVGSRTDPASVPSVEVRSGSGPTANPAAPTAGPTPLTGWVQAHRATLLWSGPDSHAVTFTDLPQWTFLKVDGVERLGRLRTPATPPIRATPAS